MATAVAQRVTPLFPDAGTRPMNVLVFGSGSGTNAQVLVEAQPANATAYKVVGFVVNKNCVMETIGKEKKLPVVSVYTRSFRTPKTEGLSGDLAPHAPSAFDRAAYYEQVIVRLEAFIKEHGGFDALVFAGWDSIVPAAFFAYCAERKIVTLNVHPADLSITKPGTDTRTFTGSSPGCVQRSLQAGATQRSSVHVMTEGVDAGPLVVLGPIVPFPQVTAGHEFTEKEATDFQGNCLKPKSDWPALVHAVASIGKGWGHESGIIDMASATETK